jgi:hypothetical protein
LLGFTRHEASFALIFSRLMPVRDSNEGRPIEPLGDQMNNINPGKKPVAEDRDQDTTFITTDAVQVNELGQGDVLSITTANNTYHVTVIDPETAQVRVRGGESFRSDTIAHLAGSSLNSSIKPLGICVGYSIEFFMHARRVRTSPVRVIRVLAESKRAA